MSKRVLVVSSISLLALVANPSQADVLLTLGVNNVEQNVCSGSIQPTCVKSAAASFTEKLQFTDMYLATPTGSNSGGLVESQAYYGFANAFTGSPFTSMLSALLSGPITSAQSFTQLDSSFYTPTLSGASAALILSDNFSDIINEVGIRTQQEYKRSYNLNTGLFSAPSFYTDLATESFAQFFSKYVGSFTGAFDELGTASIFDPETLALNSYNFTEYTGDVTLLASETVPEPGTLPLVSIAVLAIFTRFRRSKGRVQNLRTAHA